MEMSKEENFAGHVKDEEISLNQDIGKSTPTFQPEVTLGSHLTSKQKIIVEKILLGRVSKFFDRRK